jgi:hypothetical protein
MGISLKFSDRQKDAQSLFNKALNSMPIPNSLTVLRESQVRSGEPGAPRKSLGHSATAAARHALIERRVIRFRFCV